MDGRVPVVVFWAAVAVGGCAQDNPLFGLGGTGTETNAAEDPTGLVGVDDSTTSGGRPTTDPTDPIDPTDPTSTDDDDDSVDTGDDDDDDDDDDDVETDSGPGCPPVSDCILDTDPCRDDEKCAPYSSDAFDGPDAIGCTPLHPDPVGLGGRCQVNGCGFDDCDLGLVCSRDDASAVCVSLCSLSDASCGGEEACIDAIGPGASVGVCAPSCDLVEQNCLAPDNACYLNGGVAQCVPLGVSGQYEPCATINACVPGLACVGGEAIDVCSGMLCCTEYCTLGDATCPDDLQCTSANIPSAPTVGVCVD